MTTSAIKVEDKHLSSYPPKLDAEEIKLSEEIVALWSAHNQRKAVAKLPCPMFCTK